MPEMQPTSSELFQACKKIFGPEVEISTEFLEYLQPIGIKTAFRKRALETHPDRAKALGSLAVDLNAEFIDVRQAYEKLLFFVETKELRAIKAQSFGDFRTKQERPYPFSRPSSHTSSHQKARQQADEQKKNYHHQRSAHKKRKSVPDHFYKGSFPKGNLMLGQFLYYSGLISWRTLIEAILWQQRQRPQIGQIAMRRGLISFEDLIRILSERTFDEKFCGYISNFEKTALVGMQRQLQRPLGEYFVEKGILTSSEIINIINKQLLHNLTAYRWKD